jgi:hypothetical protein
MLSKGKGSTMFWPGPMTFWLRFHSKQKLPRHFTCNLIIHSF